MSEGVTGGHRHGRRRPPAWLALCVLFACANEPEASTQESGMASDSIEIGVFVKTSQEACAATYPDRIEFRTGGLYAGSKEPAGTFTVWDAGTWQVTGPGRVEISTANDAIVSYAFTRSASTLTFRDDAGCEFTYRKASG
jgi:hypothetical protein